MERLSNNKKIVFLIFLIVLIIFLTLLFTFLTKKKLPIGNFGKEEITPVNVFDNGYKRPENLPVELKTIPTLAPNEGKGLDLQSDPIKESVSEIAKIKDKLPYIKTINSGNKTVEIVIPERKYQDNDYTLLVNLSGIDFRVVSDGNDYFDNRKAFISSAEDIFNWLKQNNVDVKKIIIKWGDRTFMNDKANTWLNYVKI
jgi:hypothetical protein